MANSTDDLILLEDAKMAKEKRFENLSFHEAVNYAKTNGMKITRARYEKSDSFKHLIYTYKDKAIVDENELIASFTLPSIEAQDWIAFN